MFHSNTTVRGWCTVLSKVNYLLIDSSVLPDVYTGVIKAKSLLSSGEAASVSSAVRMAGISRSAYYKYKDKVFEYSNEGDGAVTINARLSDKAGVLSSVMNELYLSGVNILSVNQSVPVNGAANVSVTVQTADINTTEKGLLERIKAVSGVQAAEIKADGRKDI